MIKNKLYLFIISMLMILSFEVLSAKPEICFYADVNYKGESICFSEGIKIDIIESVWNDRISSIRIPRGMVITVYEHNDFRGRFLILKHDVDFLSSSDGSDFNDIISSFWIKDAACFYEYGGSFGESFCLSENGEIDLYSEQEKNISDSFNDRVSSITIPPNMQVTIYKDDHYNGNRFVLTEDTSLEMLKEIGMEYKISSIKVTQKKDFICDRFCAVQSRMIIPIKKVFGDYWDDKRIGAKQVLINLELTGNDDYLIWLSNNGLVRVKNRFIYYIHDYISNAAYYEMNAASDRVSILSRFNGGYFETQFIESVGTKTTYLSPIIGYLVTPNTHDTYFSIMNFNPNENQAIIIDKIVMTAEKANQRSERSTAGVTFCWLMPALSIYNFIVQGECNQVDRFVTSVTDFFNGSSDKILQISGSSKPLPRIDKSKIRQHEITPSSEPYGTLTYLRAGLNKQPLTLLATSLACKVSMKEQMLPNIRIRRDSPPGCIDWTLDILTDFTLLFGDTLSTWNADIFGRVIERILHHEDTGYAVFNPDAERRLVRSVGALIADNTNADIIRLKTAFDFSQLTYANYLGHNHSDIAIVSPQGAQELLLGRYELALENFGFVETIPRIRQAGQWVEHPEQHFDIEIITGTPYNTRDARQHIIPTLEEWRRIYHQPLAITAVTDDHPHDIVPALRAVHESIIPAARIVSDVINSWLRTSREDYVYVIVRFSGKIISITLAVDINERDIGIGGSLTNPAYVLHPQSEGAIRGAGTAAIRALAAFAAKKGKRALVSDVISQPSAIVKTKVGFKFIDEL